MLDIMQKTNKLPINFLNKLWVIKYVIIIVMAMFSVNLTSIMHLLFVKTILFFLHIKDIVGTFPDSKCKGAKYIGMLQKLHF